MEKQWLLESLGPEDGRMEFAVSRLPCVIGRSKECDLVIPNLGLSRIHAVLARDISGRLRLVDENSTNGTFVNRSRVDGACLLRENDIIRFANARFGLRLRFVDPELELPFDQMHTHVLGDNALFAEQSIPGETDLDDLIMGNGLSGAAQPIVDATTRQVVGYELLGRSSHPRLPASPIELFGIAESLNRETQLSGAFRDFGINAFSRYAGCRALFINAHPRETFSESLLASLERLRRKAPGLDIVVEIHESAVANVVQLKMLAARLAAMNVRYAFDDFGAGQARLVELADVPAHYVKFDMALIRSLHKASARKQQLVGDLVRMVLSTESVPLAEGVEEEEEARICADMGFALIQGYLTGRPIPAETLAA